MVGKEEVFITNIFEETRKLGEEFARYHLAKLQAEGTLIALYGDLGSGKTTFVQGLARGLGIQRRIISPTFIIVRSYKISRNILLFEPARLAARQVENYPSKNFSTLPTSRDRSKNKLSKLKYFYHVDLYRIMSDKDIKGLGLEEIMNDPQNIVAIEWAEKLGDLLPQKRWDIRFEHLGEDKRRIVIISS